MFDNLMHIPCQKSLYLHVCTYNVDDILSINEKPFYALWKSYKLVRNVLWAYPISHPNKIKMSICGGGLTVTGCYMDGDYCDDKNARVNYRHVIDAIHVHWLIYQLREVLLHLNIREGKCYLNTCAHL